VSVISLLAANPPSTESPANVDAAKQVRDDLQGYRKKVRVRPSLQTSRRVIQFVITENGSQICGRCLCVMGNRVVFLTLHFRPSCSSLYAMGKRATSFPTFSILPACTLLQCIFHDCFNINSHSRHLDMTDPLSKQESLRPDSFASTHTDKHGGRSRHLARKRHGATHALDGVGQRVALHHFMPASVPLCLSTSEGTH
jgi:hypothetical protein